MQEIILKQIKNQTLSHAYLVIGPREKRDLLIKEMISLLAIRPADTVWIKGDKETIKIAEIRQIIKTVSLRPHSSAYMIVVFSEAANMTQEAASALLKTLEEPPRYSIIILGALSEENLLSTLVSRCQKIKTVFRTEVEISQPTAALLEEIGQRSIKEKFALAAQIVQQDDLLAQLTEWLAWYRAKLLVGQGTAARMVKKIQEARKILQTNVNPRLVLENLLLDLEEK